MAKWKKNESLGKALAREGGSIAKSVGKELLSMRISDYFGRRNADGHQFGRRRS